jgi:hypothetical protein
MPARGFLQSRIGQSTYIQSHIYLWVFPSHAPLQWVTPPAHSDVLCPVCFPEDASCILITFAHLIRFASLSIKPLCRCIKASEEPHGTNCFCLFIKALGCCCENGLAVPRRRHCGMFPHLSQCSKNNPSEGRTHGNG